MTSSATEALAVARFDTPVFGTTPAIEWGSDIVAEMLRRFGVPFVALNPGSSFRGLHDSLVNYLGNTAPSMILCNHEETAVAIAHGFARLTDGPPMAAAVHANVGLLHASMAIYNAWADRAPVLVLGGTGPMTSTQRRPWVDWIHTASGQGGVVRDFTKWEHQPVGVQAIPEALLRAWHVMRTEPQGPVYVCFDVGDQERALSAAQPVMLPDLQRYPVPGPTAPDPALIEDAARRLLEAAYPVILPGRCGRTAAAWQALQELAEALGAAVVTDGRSEASFPTNHPLHLGGHSMRVAVPAVVRDADLVLTLERLDPAGTLRAAFGSDRELPHLINVSLDHLMVRSWAADYQELPPASLPIPASTEPTLVALADAVRRRLRQDASARQRVEAHTEGHRRRHAELEAGWSHGLRSAWDQVPISMPRLAMELRQALGSRFPEAILARMPLSWPEGVWDFLRPGAFIGFDGGAGLGSGPGMSVGVALAALGSGRPVVSVMGDGEFLMAPQALWTAAHHRIPLLLVIANNQSYYNDEEHQERTARARGRAVENRWIGQRMVEPAMDFAGIATNFGVEGFGPITDPSVLAQTFTRALAAVDEGRPALVDVRVAAR